VKAMNCPTYLRNVFRTVAVLAGALSLLGDVNRTVLEPAPAPVDNPLKGLVPYQGDQRGSFPHSMEFNYVPLGPLVPEEDQYDWSRMEALLDDVASRGHQVVFRIYLEYPKQKDVIPAYLVRAGLKVHRYTNTNTQPLPPAEIETPDYEDPRLRRCLTNFIAALGRKYDGDARIGFITAGLLGTWGEWHTYPRDELFASPTVQREVMDAYEAAFQKTPVLLRYPHGSGDERYAANSRRGFGYHDDSFAWATLHTGRKNDSWFYMTALMAAGNEALEKWKTRPIGGEIRPEAWGEVFDEAPKTRAIQNFRACVEVTHASWLMDSGMFGERRSSPERRRRAEEEVRRMGYEFHVPSVTLESAGRHRWTAALRVENRGVAPFYHAWPVRYGLLVNGRLEREWTARNDLTGILPGNPANWSEPVDVSGLPAGKRKLVVSVPNPLPKGRPVRFANRTQDADMDGWLTLAELSHD
jgi:hypothetical protein